MTLLENILHTIEDASVIPAEVSLDKYTSLDLSVSNEELKTASLSNAIDFELFIEKKLAENNAKVAYGGYNEERNLYKRSTIFKDTAIEERNIHIGLDLWIKAGTEIICPVDGTIHSFNDNAGLGDYGPTIIMKHELNKEIFYTLYGHLSRASLKGLTIGATYKKGQQLGTLGDAAVNGDYAPHLHFQIISDIQKYSGDYPGVCSKKELAYYLENCPDPNILLKLNA